MLKTQQTEKVDFVAPAQQIRADNGLVVINGAEAKLTPTALPRSTALPAHLRHNRRTRCQARRTGWLPEEDPPRQPPGSGPGSNTRRIHTFLWRNYCCAVESFHAPAGSSYSGRSFVKLALCISFRQDALQDHLADQYETAARPSW
jgi:hypothetical protein